MVQGGYPSTLKEHERLPCTEETFPHSSMMVDGFGIWNVKGRSHEALLLRHTTLSHRRMFLLMEYSKEKMYPFFLQNFMRRFSWDNLSLDLTFNLLLMYGKKYIYVLIDYSIEYFYLFTIYEKCIAPQESKIIYGFHGHFRAKFCNDDNPSLHEFGKVLYFFNCI